jgi:hypothetical protein
LILPCFLSSHLQLHYLAYRQPCHFPFCGVQGSKLGLGTRANAVAVSPGVRQINFAMSLISVRDVLLMQPDGILIQVRSSQQSMQAGPYG